MRSRGLCLRDDLEIASGHGFFAFVKAYAKKSERFQEQNFLAGEILRSARSTAFSQAIVSVDPSSRVDPKLTNYAEYGNL